MQTKRCREQLRNRSAEVALFVLGVCDKVGSRFSVKNDPLVTGQSPGTLSNLAEHVAFHIQLL